MAQAGGFKWIRQGFAWNDIEISGKGNFTDTRNPGSREFLGQVRLHRGPGSATASTSWPASTAPRCGRACPATTYRATTKGPPANNQDYGDFVAAVAGATRARSSTSRYGTSPTCWANGAATLQR